MTGGHPCRCVQERTAHQLEWRWRIGKQGRLTSGPEAGEANAGEHKRAGRDCAGRRRWGIEIGATMAWSSVRLAWAACPPSPSVRARGRRDRFHGRSRRARMTRQGEVLPNATGARRVPPGKLVKG